MISNAAKSFYILAISLNVPHNNFNGPIKLFLDISNQIFQFFSKIVLFV